MLHDAFFRHQKPPPLTQLGELYYEGKEFEARITNARPGILSEALREALGMQHNTPPPWLINMQRYGPPPSYPNLKIAGLNAPIPPSCQFGYHAGALTLAHGIWSPFSRAFAWPCLKCAQQGACASIWNN